MIYENQDKLKKWIYERVQLNSSRSAAEISFLAVTIRDLYEKPLDISEKLLTDLAKILKYGIEWMTISDDSYKGRVLKGARNRATKFLRLGNSVSKKALQIYNFYNLSEEEIQKNLTELQEPQPNSQSVSEVAQTKDEAKIDTQLDILDFKVDKEDDLLKDLEDIIIPSEIMVISETSFRHAITLNSGHLGISERYSEDLKDDDRELAKITTVEFCSSP